MTITTPGPLRAVAKAARDRAGITKLQERVAVLETVALEGQEQTYERSKQRWRNTAPGLDLTWHIDLPGGPFVDKLEKHGKLAADAHVVEIGPGYGRLLTEIRKRKLRYGRFTGVDLSQQNTDHLTGKFGDDRTAFVTEDAENVKLDQPADLVFSSLTFKHFFPSWEKGATTLAAQMNPGGRLVIDLIEGRRRLFEGDGETYIRWYERDEITGMLERAGLKLIGFDKVTHAEGWDRLVVVAER